MTTTSIVESGMTFGPYAADRCFHIEKSRTYGQIQQGVKMAEFLLLHEDKEQSPVLWIVEAKSSSPRKETKQSFDTFIAEVRDKLVNAFSLGYASCMKRHAIAASELPAPFTQLNVSKADVRFILVINGNPIKWLPPIQEALQKALHPTVKTWRFSASSVVVINEQMAMKHGLIQDTTRMGS